MLFLLPPEWLTFSRCPGADVQKKRVRWRRDEEQESRTLPSQLGNNEHSMLDSAAPICFYCDLKPLRSWDLGLTGAREWNRDGGKDRVRERFSRSQEDRCAGGWVSSQLCSNRQNSVKPGAC